MQERIQELRAACRPFVTRALRGPRRRRYTLTAGVIGLLIMCFGAWIAFSPGYAAHDFRTALGLEQSRWDRENNEFIIFVDSDLEKDRVLGQAGEPPHEHHRDVVEMRAQRAWLVLDLATGPHIVPPIQYAELQQRARQLRNARVDLVPSDLADQRRYMHFDWYSAREMRELEAVVEAQLVPRVVVYRSPLGTSDALRLMGLLGGGFLLLLSTVCAPLWVGTRLAQELHDNTLQPLTGTALTARQLVIGLVAGPLSPIALVAVPPLLMVLGAGLTFGRLVPALGFVVITLAMGAMLTTLAMLTALAVGRQRAPGLVGTGLLALLGMAAMVGLAVGLNISDDTLGLVTIIPNVGPVHLLTEAFNPVTHLRWDEAMALDLRLGLTAVSAIVLSVIAMRAIERWMGGTHRDGALTRNEAAGAAFLLAVLAMSAVPHAPDFGEVFFIGTAIMLVPLQFVLMARVPGGDVPTSMRQIPTVRLVKEHFGWLGFALVVALVLGRAPENVYGGMLIGLVHLGWALIVAALITIRATALPSSIVVKVWLAISLSFAMLEFGTAAIWCLEQPGGEFLFPLVAANPVLGLLQVAMFIWVPISLIRGLTPQRRPPLDLTVPDDVEPA